MGSNKNNRLFVYKYVMNNNGFQWKCITFNTYDLS